MLVGKGKEKEKKTAGVTELGLDWPHPLNN
jgi:hypothetical protein